MRIRNGCVLCWMIVVVVLGSWCDVGFGKGRPNIVFIYADDHSEAAVSAYGSKMNKTPHIDRLAKEGMRFKQSFVANSICGPARACILTGLHSHANGKMTNGGGFKDDLPTWTKLLKQSGYATAMVGKWHIRSKPNGFDYWAIAGGGYYNLRMRTADGVVKHEGYTTEIITEDALKWVKGQRGKGKPFAVWISHTSSHRTWEPGPKYLKHYDDVEIPEPATLFDDYSGRSKAMADTQMRISRDLFPAYDLKLPVTGKGILDRYRTGKLKGMTEEQRKAWEAAYGPKNEAFLKADLKGKALVKWKYQRYIKDYLRCVDALDDSVGLVMKFLKDEGLEDNTIVVYSSDQGFFLGEHGWYDKRWMYEPAFKTPLIIKWPGVTKGGSVSDALVQNIDMAPTFLEMGQVNEKVKMHGRSLGRILKGETPKGWRDGVYYHYHQRDKGRTAHTVARHYGVRTARYKLIRIYDYDDWELYDLKHDPVEMKNVYGDEKYVKVVKEMKAKLKALRKKYGDETGKAL